MKKSTIVVCIIAAVLFLAGFGICKYAEATAANNGMSVFEHVNSDNNTITLDLEDKISYILINFDKVEVTINGNSEKSYIELVNFSNNEYSVKSNGITITDSKDLFNTIYDTIKNFKGIRYFIFPENVSKGNKKINIYLSDDINISTIRINSNESNVSISNMSSNTDYTLNLTGDSDVSFDNVNTPSLINLTGITGKVSFKETTAGSLNCKMTNSNIYFLYKDVDKNNYNISTIDGLIYLNDESKGNNFKDLKEINVSNINCDIISGSIYILSIE